MEVDNLKDTKKQDSKKPLIGFLPCFYSMGEAIPLIKIAKTYQDMGGRVIFFSHKGEYEHFAEEIDCDIIELSNILENLSKKGKKMFEQGKDLVKNLKNIYIPETIEKAVSEEINAFTKKNIKLVVSSFNLTTSISARAANIPLITVVSGVTIPPFYESGYVTFPDNFENPFTIFLPKTLKNRFMQWFLLNNKMLINSFNKIAKKYNVCKYNNFNEIILGDHTFVCDDFTFLGINSSKDFPRENFIGPIIGSKTFDKKKKDIDSDLTVHLKKPGKSIVVIMGSTGNRSLFLKILKTLNQTNYNVIAVYTNLLDENEIPKTSENILFKKFVPLDEILKKVDLAIVHGGRGTIYQVAYSGKPAICFPMFMEHQGNVDNLIRQGSAVRLSKKFFKKELLLESINNIFSNYESYQQHAQQLADSLQKESGEIKAAKRLFEIIMLYQ